MRFRLLSRGGLFGLLLISLLSMAGWASALALAELAPPTPTSGNKVDWKGWRFSWEVRPREGLVLNGVSFQGRTVLKAAALAEIFVPYDPGQPRPEDSLDGMGNHLVELRPGQDCLPGTVCRMYDRNGQLSTKPVVAIHEESAGPVYFGDMGRAYGSMLVIWCASRLGDYTYLVRWRFRDDGVMMPQVGLTGRLSHTRREAGETPQGAVVQRDEQAALVWAPAHVHNFYYRLDFDIDGPGGDVVEEFNHHQDQPGRSLSSRDAWTPLAQETVRSLSGETFRSWRVGDRASTNSVGHPRSYELFPGGTGVFRGAAREEFTQGDLWVLKYQPAEFPLTTRDPRPVSRALASYGNGEPVLGEDVVLWYAMHVHHRPRTEDWPAMPVEWAGFMLAPRDFLDRSPLQPE